MKLRFLTLVSVLSLLLSPALGAATAKKAAAAPKAATSPKATTATPAAAAAAGSTAAGSPNAGTAPPVPPAGQKWPIGDKPPPPVPANLKDFTLPSNISTTVRGTGCTAAVTTCSWTCNLCMAPDDVNSCPSKDDWGITFDDGPTEFTPALLDYLKSKNIKATFFVIGSRVIDHPDILRRIYNEGHHIGVHTWSHSMLTSQTNDQVAAELWWTGTAIKAAVGVWPKYMRPPFGDIDDRVRAIVRAVKMRAVIWIEDTNDWELGEKQTTTHFTPESITNDVKGWVANKTTMTVGPITLQHDLYAQSRDLAINSVIPLMSSVYNAKTVPDCIGDPAPYVGMVAAAVNTTASATSSGNSTANKSASSPSPSTTATSGAVHLSSSASAFALAFAGIIGAAFL